MGTSAVRDAWLLPTLETLLEAEPLARLLEQPGESLWRTAVDRELLADEAILTAVAERNRLKLAALDRVAPALREELPESLARRYQVVPVYATDERLDVATADPTDLDCERALEFATGRAVNFLLASPTRIADAIDSLYRPENTIDKILENVSERYEVQAEAVEEEIADLARLGERAGERPVIRLVDYIVAEGIANRASDIHIEPGESQVAVRYRIDGVLRQMMDLPRQAASPIVSRIKIMSGLDIADRLRPQDGRARVTVNGKVVDLRISTLPAAHGEKVVIRILDQQSTLLSLAKLGLEGSDAARFEHLLDLREGMIFVTGPTGSGKTTTLYSALQRIKERDVNIVTVEDPIEYRLPGIVQVQVHEKAQLTFAAALRSILRQDPDVVLVGEVRDRETAGIAVQASLTGHLVLSTLHTIDAASSVTRLVDIGVESYKLAAAMKGIVAQRLVRRLCPTCRAPEDREIPRRVRPWIEDPTALFRPVGCPECSSTGFRGRAAVMEILIVDHAVERCIARGASVAEIIVAAREAGMRTLWEAGVQHLAHGLTSVDEVVRVLEVPEGDGPVRRPRGGRRPAARPTAPRPMPAIAPAAATAVAEQAPELFASEAFRLIDEPAPVIPVASTTPTILLVQDDIEVALELCTLLEDAGFEVHSVDDAAAALTRIDRTPPDLVVADHDMRGMDACDLLTRLRARPHTADLPVVVLSGEADEEHEIRVFALGADDFVRKPMRLRALVARLEMLLVRRGLAAGDAAAPAPDRAVAGSVPRAVDAA